MYCCFHQVQHFYLNFTHDCFDPPFTLNLVNFVKELKSGLHINVMVECQRISITNRFEVDQLQFNILVDQYNIFVDPLQFNVLIDQCSIFGGRLKFNVLVYQCNIFFDQLQFDILVGRMMFELLPARKDSIQTFQIQTRLPLTTKLFDRTSNWVKRIHEVSNLV